MKSTKIGIVEDEIIIADSIRTVLKSMNYTVPEPATDYREALELLKNEKPDLLLLDINLNDAELDGVAVGKYIRENYNLPFIFLTANSDAATLSRVKTVKPNAFLVKPFVQAELYAAIEVAMHNFYVDAPGEKEKAFADHLFIKDGGILHKVLFDDIGYIESDHVYVSIHTVTRKFLVRASLQSYIERLDKRKFVRIHRSYVVNLQKISKASATHVIIGDKELPVSKRYKDDLLALL